MLSIDFKPFVIRPTHVSEIPLLEHHSHGPSKGGCSVVYKSYKKCGWCPGIKSLDNPSKAVFVIKQESRMPVAVYVKMMEMAKNYSCPTLVRDRVFISGLFKSQINTRARIYFLRCSDQGDLRSTFYTVKKKTSFSLNCFNAV